MRHRPLLETLLLVGCLAPDPDDDRASLDAGAARDAGPTTDAGSAEGLCDLSFTPCGGDVVGTWEIDAFCPAEGDLTRLGEHPFFDVAECQAESNASLCTTVYGGTLSLAADGSAVFDTRVHVEIDTTFSEECALAAGTGDDLESACLSFENERLACAVEGDLCRCQGATSPETETMESTREVDDETLIVAPDSVEPIVGEFCVDGDRLLVSGALGWRLWVRSR